MRDVSSAQIEAPLDWNMRFVFDLLRDQLAENDLFSEVLAPDNDALLAIAAWKTDEKKD
jgi:hypothetical protein